MKYGYCRISTPKQSLDRQERNIISAYPETKNYIYREVYTGTTFDRPEWKKLRKRLNTGDTVIFDSVSRMSRNAEEGINLYMELYQQGIELVFLKEPHINTSTYRKALSRSIQTIGNKYADPYIKATNEILMLLAEDQIRLAFEQSEKEVSVLRELTREGIKTARLNGKQIGQKKGKKLVVKKKAPALNVIRKHCKAFGGTLTDEECMKIAGISRGTYFKYKKELLQGE